jgi:hypothetical protein
MAGAHWGATSSKPEPSPRCPRLVLGRTSREKSATHPHDRNSSVSNLLNLMKRILNSAFSFPLRTSDLRA